MTLLLGLMCTLSSSSICCNWHFISLRRQVVCVCAWICCFLDYHVLITVRPPHHRHRYPFALEISMGGSVIGHPTCLPVRLWNFSFNVSWLLERNLFGKPFNCTTVEPLCSASSIILRVCVNMCFFVCVDSYIVVCIATFV